MTNTISAVRIFCVKLGLEFGPDGFELSSLEPPGVGNDGGITLILYVKDSQLKVATLLKYVDTMALIKNKTARRNYKIRETYEAGIKLKGYEVKSLRAKEGSLKGAYVAARGGEAWLIEAHIPAFQPDNAPQDFDPNRTRKLLLHQYEINEIAAHEREGGIAIIPLAVYNKHGRIKVEVAVGKGKKKHDKRKDIKERDLKRETERTLKRKYQS
jgi:SsrA-binding protein